jgi:hypothetical protein
MTTHWKIFRLANYLQLLFSIAVLAILFINTGSVKGLMEISLFIAACLAFIILVFNSYLNLQIMHHHFPDKRIPAGRNKLYMVLLGCYLVVNVLLFIIFIFVLIEELSGKHSRGQLIFAGILGFDILLAVIIIRAQDKLPYLLNRNNNQSIQQLVEDIGKEES